MLLSNPSSLPTNCSGWSTREGSLDIFPIDVSMMQAEAFRGWGIYWALLPSQVKTEGGKVFLCALHIHISYSFLDQAPRAVPKIDDYE